MVNFDMTIMLRIEFVPFCTEWIFKVDRNMCKWFRLVCALKLRQICFQAAHAMTQIVILENAIHMYSDVGRSKSRSDLSDSVSIRRRMKPKFVLLSPTGSLQI